jgi:hypothetical protein
MNSAERSRTHLNESPMIYCPLEPTRTVLNAIGDPDDSVCHHKTLTYLVNLKVPHRNTELH